MNGLMIIKNSDILDIHQEVLITQDYILIQEKKMIKRQLMRNIIIQKMYGKHLISRPSEICMIITSGKMYYY